MCLLVGKSDVILVFFTNVYELAELVIGVAWRSSSIAGVRIDSQFSVAIGMAQERLTKYSPADEPHFRYSAHSEVSTTCAVLVAIVPLTTTVAMWM